MVIKRTRIAKSRQIAQNLRKELTASKIQRGMPAMSASDLARQYGVSLPTAHSAINLLVKEGLFYRVQGSGTFFNRDSAGKKLLIGIADQYVNSLYLSPEVNRILNFHFDIAAEYFRDRGCSVRIIPYAELMKSNTLRDLDGLLVSTLYIDPKSVALILESNLPFVVYRYSHTDEYTFSRLTYNFDPGMREALDFLMPNAKSKIILISETTGSGEMARKHWTSNLEDRGIKASQIVCYPVEVQEREIICYRLVRVNPEQFKNAIILASNDEIAANLINAMTLEGFVCGKDYRLVGLGNREAYGDFPLKNLGMASVDMPIRLMAEEAAKLLLHKIENHSECDCMVMIPTRFIPRASAGYFPETDSNKIRRAEKTEKTNLT